MLDNISNEFTLVLGRRRKMNEKTPAFVFLGLGIISIVFCKQLAGLIRWLDKTIWNEKARKRFPGHGGNVNPTPFGVIILGASWIACAIFFWFNSK